MTVTPRIVDGLILYGDQAYSAAEWKERNRKRPINLKPEAKERRRAYNREYFRRNRKRLNRYRREWMARHRRGHTPRLVGSLHSLACTGPIRATGCVCDKIRCYSKPALRVAE